METATGSWRAVGSVVNELLFIILEIGSIAHVKDCGEHATTLLPAYNVSMTGNVAANVVRSLSVRFLD